MTQEIHSRVRVLIKNSLISNQRLLFVILGEKGLYNVPTIVRFVEKKRAKRNLTREKASLLWLSNNSEDIRKIGWHSNKDCDVSYCSYSELENFQCKKLNFVVICDMEDSIQPLHFANIVNSTYDPGMLIFLFSKISEVEQLTFPKVTHCMKTRFRRRICATFEKCSSCVIFDDKLNVLLFPKSGSHIIKDKVLSNNSCLGEELQNELNCEDKIDDKYFVLTKQCLTKDQTKFLKQCLTTLKNKCSYSTVSASSPTGRGKSAALGLAIAGAIDMRYSNIFVSSLNFNNVRMVFKFLLEGLTALNYEENTHYNIIEYEYESCINPMLNTTILGFNIFKYNRQAVRFVYPEEVENQLMGAELVVIDDAAAIPFPLLKRLIGPYVVLMASSIEGCGASGKFLYENMINEIRMPSAGGSQISSASLFPTSEHQCSMEHSLGNVALVQGLADLQERQAKLSMKQHNEDRSTLTKIELNEPLHFAFEDGVEKWINHALCLESSIPNLSCGAPPLELCRLFYVCRETLFSYETQAERFLQQLVSLFLCAKRKISPDDILKIADADDYHIFCLLPPFGNSKKASCDILCAILVHKVKQVPRDIVHSGINQSHPLPESFNEWKSQLPNEDFLPFQGIRIVDIVTHPSYRHKDFDYDFRALQLLQDFYSGKLVSLEDNPFVYFTKSNEVGSDQNLPLLLQLSEVEPEKMEYMLVSYYLTPQLLKFWKRSGFVPMYINCDENSAQEPLCIMMKGFESEEIIAYMKDNWRSFLEHYSEYLGSYFECFHSLLALDLLTSSFNKQFSKEVLTKEVIDEFLNPRCMKILEGYCRNLSDLNSVAPCIRILSRLYFEHRLIGVDMSVIQQAIFLSFGLQRKSVNEIAKDLGLRSTQIHAKLNQVTITLTKYLNGIIEKEVAKTIPVRDVNMVPVSQSIDEELNEAAQKIREDLKKMDFSEYAIKGSEDDWEKALHTGRKTLVSIKCLRKPAENVEITPQPKVKKFGKRKK